HGPFETVVGDDRHHVAATHAQAREPRAKPIHQLTELPKGRPGERAALERAEQRSLGVLGDRGLQNTDEVVELSLLKRVGHCEHSVEWGAWGGNSLPLYGSAASIQPYAARSSRESCDRSLESLGRISFRLERARKG